MAARRVAIATLWGLQMTMEGTCVMVNAIATFPLPSS